MERVRAVTAQVSGGAGGLLLRRDRAAGGAVAEERFSARMGDACAQQRRQLQGFARRSENENVTEVMAYSCGSMVTITTPCDGTCAA
jgi:hypothetical protein